MCFVSWTGSKLHFDNDEEHSIHKQKVRLGFYFVCWH